MNQILVDRAIAALQQGRPDESVAVLRPLYSIMPDNLVVAQVMATALLNVGKFEEAAAILGRLVPKRPRDAGLLNQLAEAQFRLNRFEESFANFRKVVRLAPRTVDAQARLGALYMFQGQLQEAERALKAALRVDPLQAETHNNLGLVRLRQGDDRGAMPYFAKVVELRPDLPDGHNNLGLAYMNVGEFARARTYFDAALKADESYAQAHTNLSIVLMRHADYEPAMREARRAIELGPDNADFHKNYVSLLIVQKKYDLAERQLKIAQSIVPNSELIYSSWISFYDARGRMAAAERAAARAAAISPEDDQMQRQLAVYEVVRNPEQGLARFKKFLPRDGRNSESWQTYLFFTGTYLPPEQQVELSLAWQDRTFGPVAPSLTIRDRRPDRRLRIGYVSPDLRAHSVAYFLEPILRGHDRTLVEVFAFPTSAHADAVTARLRGLVDQWHDISNVPPETALATIRGLEIDVLVDLAGHTTGNALAVFARRAAPVQATYLGYFGTTGLRAMDYWITDDVLVPEGSIERAVEKIWRLPRCWLSYQAIIDAPPVVVPEAARRPVTFGSFNSVTKISAKTLDLWAQVLSEVSSSRLVLKAANLNDPLDQDRLSEAMAARGIDPVRLEFLASTKTVAESLALYAGIDIALDTTPYTGGTTTADALWMGVPVVTLAGQKMVERMSASMLSACGLQDLIATTPAEFVAIAAGLAAAPERRIRLRETQRDRVAASPLCDGPGLAAALEEAFRQMYHAALSS